MGSLPSMDISRGLLETLHSSVGMNRGLCRLADLGHDVIISRSLLAEVESIGHQVFSPGTVLHAYTSNDAIRQTKHKLEHTAVIGEHFRLHNANRSMVNTATKDERRFLILLAGTRLKSPLGVSSHIV